MRLFGEAWRLSWLSLCGNVGTAQEPKIRVDTTLVMVPIVATGPDGRPIHDLRGNELTIRDDGVPQEIKYLWTELDRRSRLPW